MTRSLTEKIADSIRAYNEPLLSVINNKNHTFIKGWCDIIKEHEYFFSFEALQGYSRKLQEAKSKFPKITLNDRKAVYIDYDKEMKELKKQAGVIKNAAFKGITLETELGILGNEAPLIAMDYALAIMEKLNIKTLQDQEKLNYFFGSCYFALQMIYGKEACPSNRIVEESQKFFLKQRMEQDILPLYINKIVKQLEGELPPLSSIVSVQQALSILKIHPTVEAGMEFISSLTKEWYSPSEYKEVIRPIEEDSKLETNSEIALEEEIKPEANFAKALEQAIKSILTGKDHNLHKQLSEAAQVIQKFAETNKEHEDAATLKAIFAGVPFSSDEKEIKIFGFDHHSDQKNPHPNPLPQAGEGSGRNGGRSQIFRPKKLELPPRKAWKFTPYTEHQAWKLEQEWEKAWERAETNDSEKNYAMIINQDAIIYTDPDVPGVDSIVNKPQRQRNNLLNPGASPEIKNLPSKTVKLLPTRGLFGSPPQDDSKLKSRPNFIMKYAAIAGGSEDQSGRLEDLDSYLSKHYAAAEKQLKDISLTEFKQTPAESIALKLVAQYIFPLAADPSWNSRTNTSDVFVKLPTDINAIRGCLTQKDSKDAKNIIHNIKQQLESSTSTEYATQTSAYFELMIAAYKFAVNQMSQTNPGKAERCLDITIQGCAQNFCEYWKLSTQVKSAEFTLECNL